MRSLAGRPSTYGGKRTQRSKRVQVMRERQVKSGRAWMSVCPMLALIGLRLTNCGGGGRQAVSVQSPVTTQAPTSSTDPALVNNEGSQIDWNNPEGGVPIDPAAAASKVTFSVSVPAAAGSVQNTWLSAPGGDIPPFLVFKLNGPAGRLILERQDSQQTQSDLGGLASQFPGGHTNTGVSVSIVPIVGDPNDARAMVGPPLSSLDWLEGNVLNTVVAETSNYSLDARRAEAAKLYGSAQRRRLSLRAIRRGAQETFLGALGCDSAVRFVHAGVRLTRSMTHRTDCGRVVPVKISFRSAYPPPARPGRTSGAEAPTWLTMWPCRSSILTTSR